MAIINVIKFEGDPSVLAWKHPNSALTTKTQLMVNPSQEAILFKDNIPCDVFKEGTHVLETKNIPFLQRIVNLPFGGESPFAAEVWYINKLVKLDVLWGTATPIQVMDPLFRHVISVRANGRFGIQVEDSSLFLKELVGTQRIFTSDKIVEYFWGLFTAHVKSAIAQYIIVKGISVAEINAFLVEIQTVLEETFKPVLAQYGLKISLFTINDISIDLRDPNVQRIQQIMIDKTRYEQLKYTYQEEQKLKTMNEAAKNPSSLMGIITNVVFGIGAGKQMIEEMKQQPESTKNPLQPPVNPQSKKEEKPSHDNQNAKFCPYCGTKMDMSFAFCPKCGKEQK